MLFAVEADFVNPRGGMEVMEKRCGVDFSCYSLCFYSSAGYVAGQFGPGVPEPLGILSNAAEEKAELPGPLAAGTHSLSEHLEENRAQGKGENLKFGSEKMAFVNTGLQDTSLLRFVSLHFLGYNWA